MNTSNKYGIRNALITSALIASASSANAMAQQRLSAPEIEKMSELGLNPQEFAFVKEYTALVKKFPELKGSFGLARTHQHFDVADSEVLHETTDPVTRVSKTQVINKNFLPETAVPAIFNDGGGDIFKVQPTTWCCD